MEDKIGIDKTKELIGSLGMLVPRCVKIARAGVTFGNLGNLTMLVAEINSIIRTIAPVVQELKDLDPIETVQLGQLCLSMVQNIAMEMVAST